MIIECPACHARYRIREEKLPTGGGNIKCPSCEHVFFVGPDGTTNQARATQGAAPTAPPVATGESPAVEDAAPSARGWKLRNPVGLIYDFTDTTQIRNWLGSRESFDGLSASSDGGTTWLPIREISALADVQPSGRKTVLGIAATAPTGGDLTNTAAAPPRPEAMREEAEERLMRARKEREAAQQQDAAKREERKRKAFAALKPPEDSRTAKTSKALGIFALIVLPLFAIAGLSITGVIDVRELTAQFRSAPVETTPTPPPRPAPAPPTADTPGTAAEGVAGERARAREHASQAAQAMANGEIATAIGLYERAAFLDPAHRDYACRLADLYTQAERERDAIGARQRCSGVSAAASDDDDDDKSEP